MAEVMLKHNSPEWHEFRKTGIGGSEAAAILGLSPYKTNIELWEEKTGLKPPKPIGNVEAAKYGKNAEKHITALFALNCPQYKVITYKDRVFQKDFMFCSLDGMLIEKKSVRKGVLEIKTAMIMQSIQREKWNGKIPDNHYIQLLHNMAVTDSEFGILYAALRLGEEIRIPPPYMFEKKDIQEDVDYLIEKEKEFWEAVKNKKKPPLILPQI